MSIMGLIDHPGRIKEGRILFDGKDLTKLTQNQIDASFAGMKFP
jgi:ABC-type dipeptide/oligopeptide/nickel transport system ATPase component